MGSHIVSALVLIFLARNLGWIDGTLWGLVATWWPVILVAVGIGMLFKRK